MSNQSFFEYLQILHRDGFFKTVVEETALFLRELSSKFGESSSHAEKISKSEDQLTHLSGRYATWHKEKHVADSRDSNTEIRKINHTLIELISELKNLPDINYVDFGMVKKEDAVLIPGSVRWLRWATLTGICLTLISIAIYIYLMDRMPTANFEFQTPGIPDKIIVAGKSTAFTDASAKAFSIKWIFPNGETSTEKTVNFMFPYSGDFPVKLQAFSRRGSLMNEKVVNVSVLPDHPSNLTTIKIVYTPDRKIFQLNPSVGIGTFKPGWCGNSSCPVNGVAKGNQRYTIAGSAAKTTFGSDAFCNIQGEGYINIVPNGEYVLYWVDLDNCTMGLRPR